MRKKGRILEKMPGNEMRDFFAQSHFAESALDGKMVSFGRRRLHGTSDAACGASLETIRSFFRES
jgi:hypothetical protein